MDKDKNYGLAVANVYSDLLRELQSDLGNYIVNEGNTKWIGKK